MNNLFADAEIISIYTRADAIADGQLIDVTDTAKEAGFRFPVALTRAAWEDCVSWPSSPDVSKPVHQDQSGRLWDVLFMAALAIKTHPRDSTRISYSIFRVPREGDSVSAEEITLSLVIGGGDDHAPVITIMLPTES